MKITAVELEPQDIYNILTDVFETNAIGYWAQYQDWERFPDIEGVENSNCINKISIKELNEEESDYTIPHYINSMVITLGVERIVRGEADAPRIREMILNDDIDSDGSDCIVQAGLFGEIKYG